jgi:hypothetical protein
MWKSREHGAQHDGALGDAKRKRRGHLRGVEDDLQTKCDICFASKTKISTETESR